MSKITAETPLAETLIRSGAFRTAKAIQAALEGVRFWGGSMPKTASELAATFDQVSFGMGYGFQKREALRQFLQAEGLTVAGQRNRGYALKYGKAVTQRKIDELRVTLAHYESHAKKNGWMTQSGEFVLKP